MGLSAPTPGVYQKVSGTFLSADGTLILPAGFQIISLVVRETSGFAVPAGLKIGSTNGGTDVLSVSPLTVPANTIKTLTASLAAAGSIFSVSADQTIYFNAGTKTITGATQANPCVITATGNGFVNGQSVVISGVVGMTQLNGNTYTVANKAANSFELSGIDSTGFTAYTSGGVAGGWNGASVVVTMQIAQFD